MPRCDLPLCFDVWFPFFGLFGFAEENFTKIGSLPTCITENVVIVPSADVALICLLK